MQSVSYTLKTHNSIPECRLNEKYLHKLVKCERFPLLIVYGSYKSQMTQFHLANGNFFVLPLCVFKNQSV